MLHIDNKTRLLIHVITKVNFYLTFNSCMQHGNSGLLYSPRPLYSTKAHFSAFFWYAFLLQILTPLDTVSLDGWQIPLRPAGWSMRRWYRAFGSRDISVSLSTCNPCAWHLMTSQIKTIMQCFNSWSRRYAIGGRTMEKMASLFVKHNIETYVDISRAVQYSLWIYPRASQYCV